MNFSKEFLSNTFFRQQMFTIDGWAKEMPMGPKIDDIGVSYDENGDVKLCLYAPAAKEVKLMLGTSPSRIKNLTMVKGEDGAWRGVLHFDPSFTGPVNAMVFYDGTLAIDPHLPIIWTMNQPFNAVEVPDPEGEYLLVRNVPHGTLSAHRFYAESTGEWERCLVYTPPGYEKESRSYPVLYLLNGGTDNETSWENVGNISNIMDNLIADGEAQPFLVVMANTMLRHGGVISNARDRAFEQMLLNDIMPLIENTYRVIPGREGCGIAGLSMGAYMTCDIAFAHPELFSCMGTFTASMSETPEQNRDHYEINGIVRPWPEFLKNTSAEAFENYFHVYYRSTTPQEDHPDLFYNDDALLAKAGFDKLPCYTRRLYPENTSKWNSWRLGFRDYAKLIFRW